jgi:hypothetical protein
MSFEPQKVIEFDKGKQIGQTLTQHADNIPYEDTTVGAELDSINTQLSEKIGVESVKITVPSTDNTNAYFNYPSGYSQISFVIFAIEAFNGTKFTVNPTWAQVDLYTGNGVVLFGTIPSEYKGKDLYIQYALVEE